MTNSLLSRAENHILRPGGTRGEFITLTGRKVTITGTEVHTNGGFTRPVVAKIVATQSLPVQLPARKGPTGADGSAGADLPAGEGKLHVYFITRPLEGGIAAPSSVDEMSETDVMKLLGLLRSCPDTEATFAGLSGWTADVVAALGAKDEDSRMSLEVLQEQLRDVCNTATAEILASSAYDGEDASAGSTAEQQVKLAIECLCCKALHEAVMKQLAVDMAADITELGAGLTAASSKSMDDLDIKRAFRCDLSPAAAVLSRLPSAHTPLAKLQCLRDVQVAIRTTIEKHLEASGVDLSDADLATDDYLNLLVWLLVKVHSSPAPMGGLAGLAALLPLHLEFAQRFHTAELEKSQLGYYLANIEQTLGFFRSPEAHSNEEAHGGAGGSSY